MPTQQPQVYEVVDVTDAACPTPLFLGSSLERAITWSLSATGERRRFPGAGRLDAEAFRINRVRLDVRGTEAAHVEVARVNLGGLAEVVGPDGGPGPVGLVWSATLVPVDGRASRYFTTRDRAAAWAIDHLEEVDPDVPAARWNMCPEWIDVDRVDATLFAVDGHAVATFSPVTQEELDGIFARVGTAPSPFGVRR